MIHRSPRFAWLCVLVVSLVSITTQLTRAEDKTDDEYFELMRVFVDTFEQIESNYVKDIERRELVEAAIRGMLLELDPYSNYISPDDLKRFDEEVKQEFGGIGIQVHFDPTLRQIIVVSPLPGTPAYEAGIVAGDRIVEIEGNPVKEFPRGKELDEAVKLLRGKPGDEVTIGVLKQGKSEPEDVDVARAIINVATVMGDRYNPDGTWNFMLDDKKKIGYIRLTHFSQRSAAELKVALRELQKQDMKGLILDLRYNPGGLLTQATEISDMFVESGKIVSTKSRVSRERVWTARKRGTFTGFPMAVLINRYSASASEIVSACLQDHDRAVVIGERSWGKGSVQNVIELEEGASALKLTTASYHRPSGKNIHRFPNSKETDEWGVTPNDGYLLKFSNKEMREYLEYRRNRDVLSEEGPPESDFDDTQLKKAVDYLKSELEPEDSDDDGKQEESKTEEDSSEPKADNSEKEDAKTKTEAKEKDGEETSLLMPIPLHRMVSLFVIG